jgi:hypothetical protein
MMMPTAVDESFNDKAVSVEKCNKAKPDVVAVLALVASKVD